MNVRRRLVLLSVCLSAAAWTSSSLAQDATAPFFVKAGRLKSVWEAISRSGASDYAII